MTARVASERLSPSFNPAGENSSRWEGKEVRKVSGQEVAASKNLSCKDIIKMSTIVAIFSAMMIVIFHVMDFIMKFLATLLIPTLGVSLTSLIVLPIGIGVMIGLMFASVNLLAKCFPDLKNTKGERI